MTENRQVLVVDDDQDMRDYLQTLLEDNHFEVRMARNGVEAYRMVQEERPDLILLDLQMPGETGTDFYRKLHGHTDLRDIPVIVISGVAGRNVAVGRTVVVLEKPLEEERLLEEVGKVFSD
jgi:CheY-like chemotaxis protein